MTEVADGLHREGEGKGGAKSDIKHFGLSKLANGDDEDLFGDERKEP